MVKLSEWVLARRGEKDYNERINRVRPCALSAASTGSCAADEGIPAVHGLHPAAAWTWVQARRSASRPEVKVVGFTPSFVRCVVREGVLHLPARWILFWKGSTIDMNNTSKTTVRTLTMLALLTAMSIVFSRVLSISTGFVRFNLGSLPVLLAALLFGPGAGFAVGAVADIIGGVLAGYAINPLITLGAGAIGLVAGFAWKRLPQLRLDLRLPVSVLLGHFVGSMVITSMALRIFYGYAWSVLLVRIPNALILSAVNTVLLRILLENRSLMKLAKK